MYVIYGKAQCSQCDAAKRFLQARDLDFKYLEFGTDYTIDELFSLPGASREMPQVFQCNATGELSHIGSTKELIKHVDQ